MIGNQLIQKTPDIEPGSMLLLLLLLLLSIVYTIGQCVIHHPYNIRYTHAVFLSRKKGSGTHLRFGNALSQFVLHIHIKYTKTL